MIENSKGKLFGKVSIVDIVIIALVLFAIVGAYFRFNGSNVIAENNETEFYYTMTVNEIRETNKNALERSVGTNFRLGGKIESSMGELISVESNPAKKDLILLDGTPVTPVPTVPGKYDVTLTFKVNGSMSDSGYFTPEKQEICAGKQYQIININSSVSGIVGKIWTK